MPKPMYVWSGSAWVSVASEVESLANFATQSYADNTPGARLVVPTSVAVGSGSGSVDTSGAVTFSGASSVSLNGCFSSTYQNYRIIVSGGVTSAATGGTITLRMRSGTDNSDASYAYVGLSMAAGSGTFTTTSQTSGVVGYTGYNTASSNWGATTIDIFKPFESGWTHYLSASQGVNGSSQDAWLSLGGNHRTAASFNGFTLFFPVTATGTIRVYGMKN
jgi:hypothetical protein